MLCAERDQLTLDLKLKIDTETFWYLLVVVTSGGCHHTNEMIVIADIRFDNWNQTFELERKKQKSRWDVVCRKGSIKTGYKAKNWYREGPIYTFCGHKARILFNCDILVIECMM